MENKYSIGEKFYRVWKKGKLIYGEVYVVTEVFDAYYIAIDRKNQKHIFNKDDFSLIRNKKYAIEKYNKLKNEKPTQVINKKSNKIVKYKKHIPEKSKKPQKSNNYISVGCSFRAILDNVEVEYKIVPVIYKSRPIWPGGNKNGTRFGYEEESTYISNLEKGELSESSPFAKAVLGKKIGDKFSYYIDNNEFSGTILSIRHNHI